MIHYVQQEGNGFWVEFGAFTVEEQPQESSIPSPIASILDKYNTVFTMSQGLPPTRAREHAFCLKEGIGPISVHLYRYAQAQKNEIERLMAEMLQAGIVRSSTSPFSSPMLLVKKKDGS